MQFLREMLNLIFDYYENYIYFFFSLAINCFLVFFFKSYKKGSVVHRTASFILTAATCYYMGLALSKQTFFLGTNHDTTYNFLVKIGLCIALSVLLRFAIIYGIAVFEKISRSKFICENKAGILIFIFLIFHLFLTGANEIEYWCGFSYAVDYSMGIGSRFFIGSVLSVFCGNHVSSKAAYIFCIISAILLITVVSVLLNALIKKTAKKHQAAILFLVICFLSCPTSITATWSYSVMSRLEQYALLLSLVAVLLFNKIKNLYVKYSVLTACSMLCNAIYQGYMFLYFQIVFIVMVCDVLKENRIDRKSLLLSIGSCALISASFLYFQLFSFTDFENTAQMVRAISSKTDITISDMAIDLEYFKSISYTYDFLVKGFLTGTEFPRQILLITFITAAPFIAIFVALSLKCFDASKKRGVKIWKNPLLYSILSLLFITPQYVLNVDWCRWFISGTINIFFMILYFAYIGNKEFGEALHALSLFVKRHIFVCLLVIAYFAMFSFSFQRVGSTDSVNILNRIFDIKEFLKR